MGSKIKLVGRMAILVALLGLGSACDDSKSNGGADAGGDGGSVDSGAGDGGPTSCQSNSGCSSGLYCSPTHVCQPALTVGAKTCDEASDCGSAYCDLSTAGPDTGRCCASGECCASDGDCGSTLCVESIDGTARFRCESGMANAPCDDDPDCGAGNHCRESTDVCVDGTASAPCDDNADCDSGFYCTAASVCAAVLQNGQTTCDEPSDCASLNCDVAAPTTGMCCASSATDRGATGECCGTQDADCGSGLCRASAHQCVTGGFGSFCDDTGDCSIQGSNTNAACDAPGASGQKVCCFKAVSAAHTTGACCDTLDADCGVSGDRCVASIRSCTDGAAGAPCDGNADCDSNSCNTGAGTCN